MRGLEHGDEHRISSMTYRTSTARLESYKAAKKATSRYHIGYIMR